MMTLPLFSLALFIPGLTDGLPVVLLVADATTVNIWKTINLVIFLTFLYLILRKPITAFFQERFTTIRASLEHAAKEKAAASAKLAEIDARLNKLDAEIAGIRAQAEQEAAAERERITAQARQDAEKLRTMAQREIESAKNTALAELQQFTAARSVEMAEQIIRRELTPEDDSRLFNRMTQEIQQATQAAK